MLLQKKKNPLALPKAILPFNKKESIIIHKKRDFVDTLFESLKF